MIVRIMVGVFALLLVLPGSLSAQDVEQSLGERTRLQYRFMETYLQQLGVDTLPASVGGVDTLMQTLTAAWTDHAADMDPALRRVEPYVYYEMLQHLAKLQYSAKGNSPWWARCHVLSEYMIPAFVADLADFKSKVTAEKAVLIRKSNTANTLGFAIACNTLPPNRWIQLKSIAADLPVVIDTYLAEGAFADAHIEKSLRSVRAMATNYTPFLVIKDAFYEGRLDEAFIGLEQLFEEKRHETVFLVWVGQQLAFRYRDIEKIDRALATLDLLTESTDDANLSRDSLSVWYAAVDVSHGPDRFEKAVAEPTPSVLVPTDEQIMLSGRYLDLTSGEPFDLARLAGKIVLFDFWYTSCSPCIAEIPDLNAFAEAYQDRDDFVFVSVCSDGLFDLKSEAEVRAFIKEMGIGYLTLYDQPENSLTERFDIIGYPTKIMLNAQGELLRRPVKNDPISLKVAEKYLSDR